MGARLPGAQLVGGLPPQPARAQAAGRGERRGERGNLGCRVSQLGGGAGGFVPPPPPPFSSFSPFSLLLPFFSLPLFPPPCPPTLPAGFLVPELLPGRPGGPARGPAKARSHQAYPAGYLPGRPPGQVTRLDLCWVGRPGRLPGRPNWRVGLVGLSPPLPCGPAWSTQQAPSKGDPPPPSGCSPGLFCPLFFISFLLV